MTTNPDRLFELLPTVIQMRDADQGWPLRALLRVIAEQVQVVEDDIAQLYENWFIETCQEWVVPYIGALVGYEPIEDTAALVSSSRDKIRIPRREVANTIRYRRRKGTLALLEALARDVSGWTAIAAVEFYDRLADYENLRALDMSVDLINLHDNSALGYMDTPYDTQPHTLEIRGEGITNLGVGVFVWRLRTYSVTGCIACRMDENQPEYYAFSVLGNDTPLYTHVDERPLPGELDPRQLPIPITRQALEDDLNSYAITGESQYYGLGKSLFIEIGGWPVKAEHGAIGPDQIVAADLSGLEVDNAPYYRVERGKIAVDPELGRILFAPNQKPRGEVHVWYHYGFSADIGGGEYLRMLSPHPTDADDQRAFASMPTSELGEALAEWMDTADKAHYTLIELNDSAVYEGNLPDIELLRGQSLHIRADNQCRSVLLMGDRRVGAPDGLTVIAHPGSCLILDGLLLAGRGLRVIAPEADEPLEETYPDDVQEESPAVQMAKPVAETESADASDDTFVNIIIRHSTLVPGWTLRYNCDPRYGQGASIELVNVRARLQIDRSIVGSISVAQEYCDLEPSEITITDSILDATSRDELALYGEDAGTAYATLTLRRSTVFGQVLVREMPLGENAIFRDAVIVERRQRGCVRYSYVAPGSRTPRRFRCQPDLAMQAAEDVLREAYEAAFQEAAKNGDPLPPREPPQDEINAVRQAVQVDVYPHFSSVRYGKPAYAQLASTCPVEITQGAEAGGEQGVFYHLFNPQRDANLRVRLEDFTPANTQLTLIYAS